MGHRSTLLCNILTTSILIGILFVSSGFLLNMSVSAQPFDVSPGDIPPAVSPGTPLQVPAANNTSDDTSNNDPGLGGNNSGEGGSNSPGLGGNPGSQGGGATFDNPLGNTTLIGLFEAIIDAIILIVTPIIVLAIIYAGFKYVTAGGDETKIKTATSILTWAIVGGLLILGASALMAVIQETVNEIAG